MCSIFVFHLCSPYFVFNFRVIWISAPSPSSDQPVALNCEVICPWIRVYIESDLETNRFPTTQPPNWSLTYPPNLVIIVLLNTGSSDDSIIGFTGWVISDSPQASNPNRLPSWWPEWRASDGSDQSPLYTNRPRSSSNSGQSYPWQIYQGESI